MCDTSAHIMSQSGYKTSCRARLKD